MAKIAEGSFQVGLSIFQINLIKKKTLRNNSQTMYREIQNWSNSFVFIQNLEENSLNILN